MKLTAKNLAEEINKVELSNELMKFYKDEVEEMVDLYGNDSEIDEFIDLFVEKANAYIEKNSKKDEPTPEPKKEEPEQDESEQDEPQPQPEPKKDEPETDTKKEKKKRISPENQKIGQESPKSPIQNRSLGD